MRILIYGLNYTPELTGIGKYTGEFTDWLTAQGHEICVITSPPYYPAWKIGEGHHNWWHSYQESDRRYVCRCPLWVPEKPSGFKRILHLLSFSVSSLPVALWHGLTWRPDLVWLVAPAIGSSLGAWLTARLSGAKSWLHIQDLEVDAAFDLGILSAQSLKKSILKVEQLLLRRFDCVSTIALPMQKRLEAKGVDCSKLLLFPNWVDTETIYPLELPSPMRSELRIPPEQILVLYSGNMGRKQGLEIVIEAAKIIGSKHELDLGITFLLCGDGSVRSQLEDKANGLANVKFLPLQPLENLNNLLNMADIHLLPQRADAADLVMPSKLGGILACGGAVIATAHAHTEVANVVSDAGGIVSVPEDAEQLANHILLLAQNSGDRQLMKQQARAYAVKNLSKERILENVHEYMHQLCN